MRIVLLACCLAASALAAPPLIRIDKSKAPPDWALAERALLKAYADAATEFTDEVHRQPQLLQVHRALGRQRWSGRRDGDVQPLDVALRPWRSRSRSSNSTGESGKAT